MHQFKEDQILRAVVNRERRFQRSLRCFLSRQDDQNVLLESARHRPGQGSTESGWFGEYQVMCGNGLMEIFGERTSDITYQTGQPGEKIGCQLWCSSQNTRTRRCFKNLVVWNNRFVIFMVPDAVQYVQAVRCLDFNCYVALSRTADAKIRVDCDIFYNY